MFLSGRGLRLLRLSTIPGVQSSWDHAVPSAMSVAHPPQPVVVQCSFADCGPFMKDQKLKEHLSGGWKCSVLDGGLGSPWRPSL